MLFKTGAALVTATTFLFFHSTAIADSALRISCEGSDKGAEIYVNGQYKAECPADVFVSPGNIQLRVVKQVDREYEQVFDAAFRLADDTAKRIDVQLSSPRLSAEAIRERELVKQRKERETAEAALVRARQGDVEAMLTIGQYYESGMGLEASPEKAAYWRTKAQETKDRAEAAEVLEKALAGDVAAMRRLAELYAQGKGVEQSDVEAEKWKNTAEITAAEAALAAAENGDIGAMRQLSEYYASGEGVERDAAKAKLWKDKALMLAEARRKQEKQERDRIEAEYELERLDYLQYSKTSLGLSENDPVFGTFSSPFLGLVATGMDLSYSPGKSTDEANLKKRIASRPAEFAKPDSMIAKAHRAEEREMRQDD